MVSPKEIEVDAYDALRTIQTLARVVLDSDDEELSAESLVEMQRRTLNGIVVVTEKALAKAPRRVVRLDKK